MKKEILHLRREVRWHLGPESREQGPDLQGLERPSVREGRLLQPSLRPLQQGGAESLTPILRHHADGSDLAVHPILQKREAEAFLVDVMMTRDELVDPFQTLFLNRPFGEDGLPHPP